MTPLTLSHSLLTLRGLVEREEKTNHILQSIDSLSIDADTCEKKLHMSLKECVRSTRRNLEQYKAQFPGRMKTNQTKKENNSIKRPILVVGFNANLLMKRLS